MVLDLRMPSLNTHDEYTVPSIPGQLARCKKKAADEGRPCVVKDLLLTLHGEEAPRAISMVMRHLYFLEPNLRALETQLVAEHEKLIEEGFYKALVVQMRLRLHVSTRRSSRRHSPRMFGACAQNQFQQDMVAAARVTRDLKAKTKRALSGVARGIMRSSVGTHPKEKHIVMRLQVHLMTGLGVMVGPVQPNGSRYTAVISNQATIMRIMRAVRGPAFARCTYSPLSRQVPSVNKAVMEATLQKLPQRLQLELTPTEVRIHHEPRPRRGRHLFASTFYSDWKKGATDHELLYQPTAEEVSARFYQDAETYDHFFGLPGEHVLIIPSSELEAAERPAEQLQLAPSPLDELPAADGAVPVRTRGAGSCTNVDTRACVQRMNTGMDIDEEDADDATEDDDGGEKGGADLGGAPMDVDKNEDVDVDVHEGEDEATEEDVPRDMAQMDKGAA